MEIWKQIRGRGWMIQSLLPNSQREGENQQAPLQHSSGESAPSSTRCFWQKKPTTTKSYVSCQQQNDFSKFGFVGIFTLQHSMSAPPLAVEPGCSQELPHLGFSSTYGIMKLRLKHKQLQATAAGVHFWQ